MPRPPLTRNETIGAAYGEHALRLHKAVARRTRPDLRHLVDDACSFAWMRLIDRADIEIDHDHHFVGWLYVVASRQLLRTIAKQQSTYALDAWDVAGERSSGETPLERLPSLDDAPTLIEQREQLRLLAELPATRRKTLIYRAAGHSYDEIGELLELSPRQVARHLNEGRKRLREIQRERSVVPRFPLDAKPRGTKAPPRDLSPSTTRDLELDLDL